MDTSGDEIHQAEDRDLKSMVSTGIPCSWIQVPWGQKRWSFGSQLSNNPGKGGVKEDRGEELSISLKEGLVNILVAQEENAGLVRVCVPLVRRTTDPN